MMPEVAGFSRLRKIWNALADLLDGADRIDFDTALPDEVYDLVAQGAPFPALYAGPLFVGKGGRDAQQALDDELSDLPKEIDD